MYFKIVYIIIYSDNYSVQLWSRKASQNAQHFKLEVNGLQQQKTTSGSSSVSHELKAEAAGGQAHQNLTVVDWKNIAWSESWFLLRHTDGRVSLIWHQQHESIEPTCLVSTVQAGGGGVMVCGMFSSHTLGPFIPIDHHLNATAYLSIVADDVLPLMVQCTIF